MHLTNFSVNKKNINFVKTDNVDEDGAGSKWSLQTLRKTLREQGIDDSVIFRKIEDICIKTVLSAEPFMFQAMANNVPQRDNCFELLGFDILIDSMLEPWLIEVNLSPSLGCDSPLDQRVKASLIADLFTLIGVKPFEKRKTGAEATHFKNSQIGMYYGNINPAGGAGSNKAQRKASETMKDSKGFTQDTFYGAMDARGNKKAAISQKDQAEIIKDTEMEFKRRQGFKRIFPSIEYSYYKQFFVQERPFNAFTDQRVMSKRRLTAENALILQQKLKEQQKKMTK